MFWLIRVGCLVCLASAVWAGQVEGSFERTITRRVGCRYLVSMPDGYQAGSGKRWPLIIFLHGSGESGADLEAATRQGIPKLLAAVPKTGTGTAGEAAKILREQFIVVSPQCPAGESWNEETVMTLLDEILAHHDADPKRVYLTGISLGGFATWAIGLRHADRFAVLVPICGGGSLDDVYSSGNRRAGLAIWAFHGAQDGVVPFDESQRMVNALRGSGAEEVKLSIYPDADHDSWTRTYADPDLYRWMLWHHR